MSEQAQAIDGGDRMSLVTTSSFLVAGILLFFIFFVFAFFLFLRTKHYWGTIPGFGRAFSGGFPSGATAAGVAPPASGNRRGLDPSLASFVFQPEDFPEGMECAVCLSELSAGETARRLPKCGHGFHSECIDMWFSSHSTCPVCRSSVVADPPQSPRSGAEIVEIESQEPATATGDENLTESSSSRVPASTIPGHQPEEMMASSSPNSPLSARWMPAIEVARLPASVRRFLIPGRGPRVADLEQGGGGLSGPKAPPPARS